MERPSQRWGADPSEGAIGKASRSRGRVWLFRLVACAVPLLIGTIVIVVILIRQERLVVNAEGKPQLQSPPIYLEEPGYERTGHRYVYDSVLGWRNIPNWKATTNNRKLTINSQGLRDKEYPFEKPIGVSRILVLGDSYAWGYGVGDTEIFTEVLESRIQTRQSNWEVINAGVSGWGTDQEYLYLVNEGVKYSPDIVVLALFLVNDPKNNVHCTQYGLHKPLFLDAGLTLGNSPVPRPGEPSPELVPRVDPLELTIAIIERIRQVTESNHCEFVVMKFGNFLFPENQRLAAAATQLESRLSGRLGLRYLDLDLSYQLRSIDKDELLEGNDDGHWNARGHSVTAEILHQFLIDNSLLGV